METETIDNAITLPIFSQLLEPEGIAPAQDFQESGKLLCNSLPSIQLRSQIRFIVGGSLEFVLSEDAEVRRMLKHWRAELSPQIEGSEDDVFVSGFDEDDFIRDGNTMLDGVYTFWDGLDKQRKTMDVGEHH